MSSSSSYRQSSATPLGLQAGPLTTREVVAVARHGRKVRFGDAATLLIGHGRAALEGVMNEGEPHYGINTGFGSLSRQRIGGDRLRELQRNLVRSHACGVGEPLPTEIVRGMLLLLAASLCRGRSGVRRVVVETLIEMLNRGVTPVVPSIGSVGASGDLAPLSHAALVMIGEGEAELGGTSLPGAEALQRAGVEPLVLEAKEGLALINGTHLMAAQGALLIEDVGTMFQGALAACAMSIDACRATDAFLDPRVYEVRRQPGPARVAAAVRSLLEGSEILPSHVENDPRVQDPYSIRCMAPVLGAAWDATQYVRARIEDELGAVTDNPLVFALEDGGADIISAGNFHGMPVALPLDVLAMALCHVAGIAERRVYHMLSGFDPETLLPHYLSPDPGLHSGLMIVQYTAAACCNEMIGLATPASVANLSTSAGIEDYNSFGPRSAAKARRSLELARSVIAIELLCASRGIELHRPLRSGRAVEEVIEKIRQVSPPIDSDRPFAADISAIETLLRNGELCPTLPGL